MIYRTAETFPGPVHTIGCWSDNPSFLHISWTDPVQPNGVITMYRLQNRQTRVGDCQDTVNPRPYNVDVTALEDTHTFYNLRPYRKYEVKVIPVNGAGEGGERSASCYTQESVPTGAPVDVTKITFRTYVDMVWVEPSCEHRNGKITHYEYHLEGLQYANISRRVNVSGLSARIGNLVPFARYRLSLTPFTRAGMGTNSTIITFRTQTDVPPPPRDVHIPISEPFSVTVQWRPPSPPHGVIKKYRVKFWLTNTYGDVKYEETNSTFVKLSELQADQYYDIQVRARTSVGWGHWSSTIIAFTQEKVPSAPQSFGVSRRRQDRLTLSWKTPKYPNGIIKKYRITCTPVDTGQQAGEAEMLSGNERDVFNLTISNLNAGSEYMCSGQAATSAGFGNTTTRLYVWTLPKEPEKPVVIDKEVDVTESTITFTLPEHDHHDDSITSYEILVDREEDASVRRKRVVLDTSATWFPSCNATPSERDVYVTAELSPNQAHGTFTVGDDRRYGQFWNCPLVEDETYTLFYVAKAVSKGGDISRAFSMVGKFTVSPPVSIVTIALAVGIPVIIAVAISVFVAVFLKRQRKEKDTTISKKSKKISEKSLIPLVPKSATGTVGRGQTEESPAAESVALQEGEGEQDGEVEEFYVNVEREQRNFHLNIRTESLLSYINWCRENDNSGFIAQYTCLPAGLQSSIGHKEGSRPENRPKNRFANIMAYDHSRVILDKTKNVAYSDYINACFITGYTKPKKFIASQGPTDVMISDFWRMIWQYSIPRIVMVTNLVEQGRTKCVQYWPKERIADHVYAEITIHLEKEEILSDFTIRTLILSKGKQSRTVWQFHYTAWPDHGVPDHATSLLGFRRKVAAYDSVSRGPTVVHCSAGVGRTGTYIALDYLLEQAKAEGQVQVYSFVELMRQQRVNMIQTLDQYIFLYSALFEGIRSGDTIVTAPEFMSSYETFTKVDPVSQTSKLEEQFDLLLSMQLRSDPDEEHARAGRRKENANKNRSLQIIPKDHCRPYLSTPAENATNYINAVHIDGYKRRNAFIVTQMPLTATQTDFWRLVVDHRSATIIMLNTIDEGEVNSLPYWPEDSTNPSLYGPIHVIHRGTRELRKDAVMVHTLRVSSKIKGCDDLSWEVKLFQIVDWPPGVVAPPTAATLLYVLDEVEQWQRYKEDRPAIVHCLDGASRSGVFVALSYILEKLKLEREIDIFNAVRHIQVNRPQLVESKEQYKFCHDAVVEYISSCETYSNFA